MAILCSSGRDNGSDGYHYPNNAGRVVNSMQPSNSWIQNKLISDPLLDSSDIKHKKLPVGPYNFASNRSLVISALILNFRKSLILRKNAASIDQI